jgi:carbamoyl-phosphate synthase large subunit
MMVTKAGKIWTNVSIRNEPIFAAAKQFAKTTRWAGGYELELIQKAGTAQWYLIEINPRFPSWVYFATAIGVNLPQMLVQIIESGDCAPKLDYPIGKYLVRYSAEFATDLAQFQNLISHRNRNGT